ncbi:MAG: D-aminoacylase [Nitrospirae bacterium]|nr:D-aminoacylase [Nitrospirota bacterium]
MTDSFDLLIRGGKIYDGSGGAPFAGDIGLRQGTIAYVGPRLSLPRAGKVVPAEGLSVAPGFIDAHAHSEFTLLADNRAEGKILQGVTTEVNGNCGMSAAPLFGEALEHREKDLEELGIGQRWSTFGEYFRFLEQKGIALNFATLAGHGNVRGSVIGYADRQPDERESLAMETLLKAAVLDGALGLSTGLIYPPGIYAATEEIIGLARCIKDCMYATHMRSESDELLEAVEEALRIGRESGIAVQISHIKTGGKNNWDKREGVVSLIEGARSEGVRATCDRYPYTAASTDLDAVLPSWAYAGGAEEEMRRLEDAETRDVIRDDILSRHPEDDYWESVVVSSVASEANRWMEGKTLACLSDEAGRRPADFLIDVLRREKLRVGAIFHSMNEDNLIRFLSLPYVMIGSDSSVRGTDGPTHRGKPHPRGFGTFPRFLGRYARDLNLMDVSEAVHKATMLPATTFGLTGRGRIRVGFWADLVVFDEGRIIDRATFEEPFLTAEGIAFVFVNGTPVVWEGSSTGALPGKILRNGG